MPSNPAAELSRLAEELRVQANGGLRRELATGIRSAAAPLTRDAQQAAGHLLPQSGGLAARVAAQPVKVSVSTAARTVGVRLKSASLAGQQANDDGAVQHPVFNNRKLWRSTPTPGAKNWWTSTLDAKAPAVVGGAVEAVMTAVTAKLEGGS